jgi:hypothetical protein
MRALSLKGDNTRVIVEGDTDRRMSVNRARINGVLPRLGRREMQLDTSERLRGCAQLRRLREGQGVNIGLYVWHQRRSPSVWRCNGMYFCPLFSNDGVNIEHKSRSTFAGISIIMRETCTVAFSSFGETPGVLIYCAGGYDSKQTQKKFFVCLKRQRQGVVCELECQNNRSE